MNKTVITKKGYVPCKRTSNGVTTIMFEYEPITDKVGRCFVKTFYNAVSLNDIKSFINGYYNQVTSANILSGMTFRGKMVWLSSENQQNYKSAYDLAVQTSGESLPLTIKAGSDDDYEYIKLTTLDEVTEFYRSVYNHIQKCIQDGWNKKDAIDWTLYI